MTFAFDDLRKERHAAAVSLILASNVGVGKW